MCRLSDYMKYRKKQEKIIASTDIVNFKESWRKKILWKVWLFSDSVDEVIVVIE